MNEEEKKALAASLRGIDRAISELHRNSTLALIVAADYLDPPNLPEPNRSSHQS